MVVTDPANSETNLIRETETTQTTYDSYIATEMSLFSIQVQRYFTALNSLVRLALGTAVTCKQLIRFKWAKRGIDIRSFINNE